MKNLPKKPEPVTGIFSDIQNEVSAESAPLLQFISRYAGWIAAFVIILVLILAGTALWNWYYGGKLEEARSELARVNLRLQGEEKEKALAKLVETVPDDMKMFAYMSLGHAALENNNANLAADAYAKAASLGENNSLAHAAAMAQANILLGKGEFQKGLDILKKMAENDPTLGQTSQFKEILAEAAQNAGDNELARTTYEELAKQANPQEAGYYRSRAAALQAKIQK